MKTIEVAAAIITNNLKNRTRIFATQRGYGDYKGWWEFPGGKIEAGESPKQALKREILEELDVQITVGPFLSRLEYDYPDFHLSMDCFWAEIIHGTPKLLEAKEAKWLTEDELYTVNWLPADLELIPLIQSQMHP